MFGAASYDKLGGESLTQASATTSTEASLDRALALAFSPVEGGDASTWPEVDRDRSFPSQVPGRYHVIEPIAYGGQGVVVRVRDTNLGRELALKTIHSDPAKTDQARARLGAEARVLASLEHPGV